MKYTVTMTKDEIKNLFTTFAALSKTILNAVLPQIDEDYTEIFESADASFDKFLKNMNRSGGMSNKDFTIEHIVHNDTITVNAEMDIKLLTKVLSFYKKFLADILPYIVAFCKKHNDELDDLTEFLNSRAEAMSEELMEMIEDFDLDALQDSAWGCFKDMNPINNADSSFEDSSNNESIDEMVDEIVKEEKKLSKEEELERKYHSKNTEE